MNSNHSKSQAATTTENFVYIAGGGTGGHIYPGLAIAKELNALGTEVIFVGTSQGLENKIVPREGFELRLISSSKFNFQGKWLAKAYGAFALLLGLLEATKLIIQRKPSFVLGVGGYASFPLVFVASLLGIPTAIWEPNALPGLANRWLSRFVDLAFIVFPEAKLHLRSFSYIQTGMPLRTGGSMKPDQADDAPKFIADFKVLHTGGSQGSRTVGQSFCEMILHSPWPDTAFVHQTGHSDFKGFQDKYLKSEHSQTSSKIEDSGQSNALSKKIQVCEYIYNMPAYYNWCDIVIGRGGASTIAEIAAFGKPSIIVPLAAADGHQIKNAQALVSRGAAKMILQKDLSPETLEAAVRELKDNITLRHQMSAAALEFARPNGATEIASHIKSLLVGQH